MAEAEVPETEMAEAEMEEVWRGRRRPGGDRWRQVVALTVSADVPV